jgi:hypothetical protein
MTTRQQRLSSAVASVVKSLGARRAVFGAVGVSSSKSPVATLYAAYLHSVVCDVLASLNLNPVAITAGHDFVYCCGRGVLSSTPNPFSYVEFSSGADDYELHFGIEVACRSPGVCLELDLAIIDKRHAEKCRLAMQSPSYRKVRLAFEFKDYTKSVDVVPAKAFVGVSDRIRVRKSIAALVTSGAVNPQAALLLEGVKPSIGCYELVSGRVCDAPALNTFKSELLKDLPTVL